MSDHAPAPDSCFCHFSELYLLPEIVNAATCPAYTVIDDGCTDISGGSPALNETTPLLFQRTFAANGSDVGASSSALCIHVNSRLYGGRSDMVSPNEQRNHFFNIANVFEGQRINRSAFTVLASPCDYRSMIQVADKHQTAVIGKNAETHFRGYCLTRETKFCTVL
jgi:hypothetical protein